MPDRSSCKVEFNLLYISIKFLFLSSPFLPADPIRVIFTTPSHQIAILKPWDSLQFPGFFPSITPRALSPLAIHPLPRLKSNHAARRLHFSPNFPRRLYFACFNPYQDSHSPSALQTTDNAGEQGIATRGQRSQL